MKRDQAGPPTTRDPPSAIGGRERGSLKHPGTRRKLLVRALLLESTSTRSAAGEHHTRASWVIKSYLSSEIAADSALWVARTPSPIRKPPPAVAGGRRRRLARS
jgi:hypothetical protein